MCVHVRVLNVEKHFQTTAVNVIKVLNSALNAIKSFGPNMTCVCMYLYLMWKSICEQLQ